MRSALLLLPGLLASCASAPGSRRDAAGLEPLPAPAEVGAFPSLARGADGRVHLVWLEPRGPRSARLRYARLEGDAWGPARTVAEGDDWFLNWADFPSVAALSDGTLLAHWLRTLGEGTYAYGVQVARSSDGGRTWSAPSWLHDDRSPAEHGFASLAALDDGTFGAVWLDARAGAPGEPHTALWFRTVGRDGELGPEELLDPLVCDCCQTALVRTAAGELVAAYRDRTDFEVRDVAWVRRSPQGWQGPRTVHDDGWVLDGCPVNGPRLVAAGRRGEEPLVAWYTGAGGEAGCVLVRAAGSSSAPLRVDDGLPEGRVGAAQLADGGLLVTWLEHGGPGAGPASGPAWRARCVTAAGELGPSVEIARVSSDRSSGFLRAAPDGDTVLLAWTEPGPSPRLRTARLRPPLPPAPRAAPPARDDDEDRP